MRFVKEDGLLTVHVDNPRSTTPTVCELYELGSVQSPIVELILQAYKRKSEGSSHRTQINYIGYVLRPLGIFLALRRKKAEVDVAPGDFSGWQSLVCDFAIWWLTRTDSVAKLETRCTGWKKFVRPFFQYLQAEDIMPLGLVIPALKLPKEQISYNPRQPKLLGESPAVAVPQNHQVEKAPIDKTLVGPIFWRSDAEYLDEIETVMRSRDTILGTVLDDYWLKLVQDYRAGLQLTSQIDDSEWLKRLNSNDWVYGHQRSNGISFVGGGSMIPLCSPRNPDGHLYLLKLMQHMVKEAKSESDVNNWAIRKHPAVNTACLKRDKHTPIAPLRQLTALTDDQTRQLSLPALVWRFAGVLSPIDIAVAMAILIREHANVTPVAIAGAMLLNARGKSYLLLTDDRSAAAIFSVNKRRAGCRKYMMLNKRSARIIRHILRATAPIRALLKRSGHPHWRYLFLGRTGRGGLGHHKDIAVNLLSSSDKNIKLGVSCLYPCLAEVGLGVHTLDFSKIRATQGVLAWFDKGSVHAVHRRLGNSYRTSIEHYIPETLLSAWNERIIRRFQNTLLVLAAAEEGYLLDVVDMPNTYSTERTVWPHRKSVFLARSQRDRWFCYLVALLISLLLLLILLFFYPSLNVLTFESPGSAYFESRNFR